MNPSCKKKAEAPKNNPEQGLALCHSGWRRANVTLPQRGWSHQGFRPLAMTSRTRFLITAALVCHLLLAPSVVTSQLLFPSGPPGAQSSPPSAPSTVREQDVTIRALPQEKDGAVYQLRGQAETHYG